MRLTLKTWERRGSEVTGHKRAHASHLTHPSHASHHLWWNWDRAWGWHSSTSPSSPSSLTSSSVLSVIATPPLPRSEFSRCFLGLIQLWQAFLLAELVRHLLLLQAHLGHHGLCLLDCRVLAHRLLFDKVNIGPLLVPVQMSTSASTSSTATTLLKTSTASLKFKR